MSATIKELKAEIKELKEENEFLRTDSKGRYLCGVCFKLYGTFIYFDDKKCPLCEERKG